MILRVFFLVVVTLCWLNAIIIAANGWLVGGAGVLSISLSVALVYAAIGLVVFFIQKYLLRTLSQVLATSSAFVSLRRLAASLAIGAAALGLVMALSLFAIIARIGEGYAIFG